LKAIFKDYYSKAGTQRTSWSSNQRCDFGIKRKIMGGRWLAT